MNVTLTSSAPRGSKLSITASGSGRPVTATIELGGTTISVKGTVKPGGISALCIRLPASFKGIAQVTVSNGQETSSHGLLVF